MGISKNCNIYFNLDISTAAFYQCLNQEYEHYS